MLYISAAYFICFVGILFLDATQNQNNQARYVIRVDKRRRLFPYIRYSELYNLFDYYVDFKHYN